MKFVEAGLSGSGLSCIKAVRSLTFSPDEVIQQLMSTPQFPLTLDPATQSCDLVEDDALIGKSSRWAMVRFAAGIQTSMHRANAISMNVVLSGQITLILQQDTIVLHACDSVVLFGGCHAWATGPEDCVMSSVAIPFQAPQ